MRNRIFSYVLTLLLGAACACLINFYWADIQGRFFNPYGLGESEEIAAAEQQIHDGDDEPEPEEGNLVKLSEEQIEKLGLQFRIAGPGNLCMTLSTRGKIVLHPDRLVHVIPKVSGVATEANKNIGNSVKAGDILAVLESHDMADIKASYLAALSKKRLAASSLEREEKLFHEKISAEQDYLNAKNAYEESLIHVQLVLQKLHAFGLDQEELAHLAGQNDPDFRLYQIRSPIDGIVIMRHLTKGEFVDNSTTIYEVADLNTVWVEIGIYPKDLSQVKEGQIVEVVAPVGNKRAGARLIYVSPIVTDETITAKAIAELDNIQELWKPGSFVKVNIATEKSPFPLVIPKEAVQNSDGKDFVFIVTPEGFEKRVVKLGQSDPENVEIISGLNPAEQYVANKTFWLKAELGKGSVEDDD